MVLRRFERKALVYDGLQEDGIVYQASETLDRMVELLRDVEPEMQEADAGQAPAPFQEDQWSCGHRIILYVRALMARGLGLVAPGGGWLEHIDTICIHDEDVTPGSLDQLCKDWDKLTVVKTVKEETSAGTAFGSSSKVDKPRPVAAPLRSSRAAPKVEKPSEANVPGEKPLDSRPPSNAQASASAGVKPEPAAQSTDADASQSASQEPQQEAGADATTEDLSLEEALGQEVEKMLIQRKAKIAVQKDEKLAKAILQEANLDFNSDWQKRHSTRLGKGHWPTFLSAVVAVFHKTQQTGLTCQICRHLLDSFDVPAAAERVKAKKQTEKQVPLRSPSGSTDSQVPLRSPSGSTSSATAGESPQQAADVAPEREPAAEPAGDEPPMKRARRGRPKKGETSEFNVMNFIAAERPGQYHQLSRQEVSERLPQGKATDEAIATEMAQNPIKCLVCGVHFHLHVLTNDRQLFLGGGWKTEKDFPRFSQNYVRLLCKYIII